MYIPMTPFYIKKEDAREVVRWQRTHLMIVLVAVALVLGLMSMVVYPRLQALYLDFGMTPPVVTQSFPRVSLGFGVGMLLMLARVISTPPDYSRIDAITKKYKAGEMIKTRELMSPQTEWLAMAVLLAMVGYIVMALIMPIYDLTSQI